MRIYEDATEGVGQVNIIMEWISIEEMLPVPMDYWFCEGVLFIKKCLPKERIAEIINQHCECIIPGYGGPWPAGTGSDKARAIEIVKKTVEDNLLQANDLNLVRFTDPAFPLDHYYYEGNLFIRQGLPAGEVKEIIKDHIYPNNREGGGLAYEKCL